MTRIALISILLCAEVCTAGTDQALPLDKCRLLLIPLTLGEKPHCAFVDTGSSHTIVHGTHETPGLSGYSVDMIHSVIAGSVSQKMIYREVPVDVSGCGRRMLSVAELNLQVFPGLVDYGITSVLGMDYLRHCCVVIPAGSSRVELLAEPPDLSGMRNTPLRFALGRSWVSASLPAGVSTLAILDTGAIDDVQLPIQVISRLLAEGHVREVEAESRYTARGPVDRRRFILRRLDIFGVRFSDLSLGEAEEAVVGLKLMMRIGCVIDYPSRKVWTLHTDDQSTIRCTPDASGLWVSFDGGGRAVVRAIRKQYPTTSTRISVGDELLMVNTLPVRELSIHQIDEIFCKAGETVHLKLKSGDREYEVDLKLDRPFEYPPKWDPEDPDAAPRPFPKLDDEPRKE